MIFEYQQDMLYFVKHVSILFKIYSHSFLYNCVLNNVNYNIPEKDVSCY